MPDPTAIVIIVDGVEELEAVAPIDCLRRAGVHTTVASANTGLESLGRNGIRLIADVGLDECLDKTYDLLVIPGGPGHVTLSNDQRVLSMLAGHNEAGKLIGSICAGPVVLDKAGVLGGKAFTSFPGTSEVLPGRDAVSRVVRDGNMITSQGAGTATEFALALVEAVCGEAVRKEIAASICA